MFTTIDYLREGNPRQKSAYKILTDLRIMKELSDYTPILCGTIPISIDVKGSDLDIIMNIQEAEFPKFENKVREIYGSNGQFRIKRYTINALPVIKANFVYHGFGLELFGQPKPIYEQRAYQHMMIEYTILEESPEIRKQVMDLKNRGVKTEPAFAKVIGLIGDPYEELIKLGKKRGIIK